jgi:hypothetical protein
MDPQTAAAFANSVAHLNILYLVVSLLCVVGVFWFVVGLGEKALGFDAERFVNNVESAADEGNCWPGVALALGVMALLGVVLRVAL